MPNRKLEVKNISRYYQNFRAEKSSALSPSPRNGSSSRIMRTIFNRIRRKQYNKNLCIPLRSKQQLLKHSREFTKLTDSTYQQQAQFQLVDRIVRHQHG